MSAGRYAAACQIGRDARTRGEWAGTNGARPGALTPNRAPDPPLDLDERRAGAIMVPVSPALVTGARRPRNDDLDDATAADLRQRIRLALSLLGHRADDDEVLHELLRQVLQGVPLMTLAGGVR